MDLLRGSGGDEAGPSTSAAPAAAEKKKGDDARGIAAAASSLTRHGDCDGCRPFPLPLSPPPPATAWRTLPFTGEFRDPSLERAFWRHPRDSGRLSQLDALAAAVLCFCLLTAVAVFGRHGMSPWPCSTAAAMMLALAAAVRRRWRPYERHRTMVVSLARVVVVFAVCSSAFLSLPLFAQAWGAKFLQSGGSRSSGAAHTAALALVKQLQMTNAEGCGGSGGGGASSSPPSSASAIFLSNLYASSFGTGFPGHWVTAVANSPPWARRWSAFFLRTPRVQALLLPSLLVMPPRAHAFVSLLCAQAALAVLGSTVAGREAYFGREKHVQVANFLSSLTCWLVRLPSSSLIAAAATRSAGTSGSSRNPPCPLQRREIAEDRATGAVMIFMQVWLGLLLPSHVMLAWQKQARRAFRDSAVAAARMVRRRRREEGQEEEEEEEEERDEVGAGKRRRRRPSPPPLHPPSSSSSSSSAALTRSARVDSALLALGLQVSAVVCFWFVLQELDALAGERRLWFLLP